MSMERKKVIKKQRRRKENDLRESNSYDLWRRLKMQRAAKFHPCVKAPYVRHWRRWKE
jgi:hypothetical protein